MNLLESRLPAYVTRVWHTQRFSPDCVVLPWQLDTVESGNVFHLNDTYDYIRKTAYEVFDVGNVYGQ